VITAQLVRFVTSAAVQVAVANVRVRNAQMSGSTFELVLSTFHMSLLADTVRREVLVCIQKKERLLVHVSVYKCMCV